MLVRNLNTPRAYFIFFIRVKFRFLQENTLILKAKKVVITGSPGTGKTSIINELKNKNQYCFDEIIRTLTLEAKNKIDTDSQLTNPIAFVDNPLDFNTKLLEGRIHQFNEAKHRVEALTFFDRGIPDVIAYMDFFNQTYDDKFTNACNNFIYDMVFLLPPWKAIYKCDNERFETFEEAKKIHNNLKQVYHNLEYKIIEVPFGTIEERTNFILNTINM